MNILKGFGVVIGKYKQGRVYWVLGLLAGVLLVIGLAYYLNKSSNPLLGQLPGGSLDSNVPVSKTVLNVLESGPEANPVGADSMAPPQMGLISSEPVHSPQVLFTVEHQADSEAYDYFNGGQDVFESVWRTQLKTDAFASLDAGDTVIMYSPYGEADQLDVLHVRSNSLGDRFVEGQEGEAVGEVATVHTLKAVQQGRMWPRLLMSVVEKDGEIAVSGTYATASGDYALATREGDSTVYLMKYSKTVDAHHY